MMKSIAKTLTCCFLLAAVTHATADTQPAKISIAEPVAAKGEGMLYGTKMHSIHHHVYGEMHVDEMTQSVQDDANTYHMRLLCDGGSTVSVVITLEKGQSTYVQKVSHVRFGQWRTTSSGLDPRKKTEKGSMIGYFPGNPEKVRFYLGE